MSELKRGQQTMSELLSRIPTTLKLLSYNRPTSKRTAKLFRPKLFRVQLLLKAKIFSATLFSRNQKTSYLWMVNRMAFTLMHPLCRRPTSEMPLHLNLVP